MGFVCDQSAPGDLGKQMCCTRGRCPRHFTVLVYACIVVHVDNHTCLLCLANGGGGGGGGHFKV